MSIGRLKTPVFKPPKEMVISWDTFRKGLNLFGRENEIDKAEMVTADDLVLKGSGVPTKRWGSRDYFMAGPTGATNFVGSFKNSDDTIDVLSLTNDGVLTKKSGASYSNITGYSWPSGARPDATQLGDKVYFVCPQKSWTKYDFSTLTGFAQLTVPTGTAVTNISGATGTSTYSWRVTASGIGGGETTASTPISLASIPQDLSKTLVRVSWTALSAASGDLLSYNIYRGSPGNEVWAGGVDKTTNRFDDYGVPAPDPFRTCPTANTTTGYTAKYIVRFQDRLIMAGIDGNPTAVLISGRYTNHERFDWYGGGGSVLIEPDSGQNVTGLGIYQEKLIVFKENSVWQLSLNQVTFGQYVILDPQYKLLTASQGCSSHRSIVAVENELMFVNKSGIYILRYEPQLYSVINANEISAKIKPFFEALTDADATTCSAMYANKKYVLSFPNSKQTIIFDRERLAFMGPWNTPYGISQWCKYTDSTGVEHWIAADSTDNYVSEFSPNFTDDKGTVIGTIFKSKKDDGSDWTLFKTLNEVYFYLKSVTGTIQVTVYIEDRDGSTISAKAFTLTGAESNGTSGFGTDQFGMIGFGLSDNTPTASVLDIKKKALIYKGTRIVQIEIKTIGRTDNYELLAIKSILNSQARGNSPSSWTV